MLDIDVALQQSPLKLLEAVGEHAEVGFFNPAAPRAPWLDIAASVFVARPTAPAMSYARSVRNYICHFLSAGTPHWQLDQMALYCTYRMLEMSGRGPRVCFFKEAAQATVFHVGHSYDELMEDERYARFS
jgi:hypothetical protein